VVGDTSSLEGGSNGIGEDAREWRHGGTVFVYAPAEDFQALGASKALVHDTMPSQLDATKVPP